MMYEALHPTSNPVILYLQVILVGHDLGGLSVTYGLENYHQKVSVGVYIAAMMLPSRFPLTLEVIFPPGA